LNHEDRSIRCEVLLFVGELFSENEARLIYKNMSKDKDSFVSKTASNLYRFGTAYS